MKKQYATGRSEKWNKEARSRMRRAQGHIKALEAAGMTCRDIARKLNICHTTVYDWQRGDNAPQVRNLDRLTRLRKGELKLRGITSAQAVGADTVEGIIRPGQVLPQQGPTTSLPVVNLPKDKWLKDKPVEVTAEPIPVLKENLTKQLGDLKRLAICSAAVSMTGFCAAVYSMVSVAGG